MIKIREFQSEDTNFILDSWLRSFYSSMTGYKESSQVFFPGHQKQIEKLKEENRIICLIACLEEDPSIILGYAVFGTDYTLHYILTKQTYQRLGVAKKLLSHMLKDKKEVVVSHWTKDLQHLKKNYKLIYNKYRFFT